MLVGLYSVALLANLLLMVFLFVDIFVSTETALLQTARSNILEWTGLDTTWSGQYIFQDRFISVEREEVLPIGTMILIGGSVQSELSEDWMLCEGQVLTHDNNTSIPPEFILNTTHWKLPDMTGDREIRGGKAGSTGGNFGPQELRASHLPPHEHSGDVSTSDILLDFSHNHIVDTMMESNSGKHAHDTPDVLEENDVRSEWTYAPHTHDFECELSDEQHQHPLKQQFITHTADEDVNPRDGNGIWSRTFLSVQTEKKDDVWTIPVMVTSGAVQRLAACPGFTLPANVSHAHEAVGMSRLHPFHGGIKSHTENGEQIIGANEQDPVRFGHAHGVIETKAHASSQSNQHKHVILGNTYTSGDVASCGEHKHNITITNEEDIQYLDATSVASVVQPWVSIRCIIKIH